MYLGALPQFCTSKPGGICAALNVDVAAVYRLLLSELDRVLHTNPFGTFTPRALMYTVLRTACNLHSMPDPVGPTT